MRSTMIAAMAVATVTTAQPVAPVLAQGVETQIRFSRVYSITPQCNEHPNAPVIGRVSGSSAERKSRGLSFVGCFETFQECEDWRAFASSNVAGRFIQNRCEQRY